MKPTNKVLAGVAAGAGTTVAAWAARAFGGVDVPAEVQGAITIVLTFCVQYLVPDADAQDDVPTTQTAAAAPGVKPMGGGGPGEERK